MLIQFFLDRLHGTDASESSAPFVHFVQILDPYIYPLMKKSLSRTHNRQCESIASLIHEESMDDERQNEAKHGFYHCRQLRILDCYFIPRGNFPSDSQIKIFAKIRLQLSMLWQRRETTSCSTRPSSKSREWKAESSIHTNGTKPDIINDESLDVLDQANIFERTVMKSITSERPLRSELSRVYCMTALYSIKHD